jgi:hypothetical protein
MNATVHLMIRAASIFLGRSQRPSYRRKDWAASRPGLFRLYQLRDEAFG